MTQPTVSYGRQQSQPTLYSKGVQPMQKAVHHTVRHDKHDRSQLDHYNQQRMLERWHWLIILVSRTRELESMVGAAGNTGMVTGSEGTLTESDPQL